LFRPTRAVTLVCAMLLPIHIAAGGLALVLGALALMARKGGRLHRRSGVLFVYAMVVMAGSAAVLGNVGGGLMTIYFVSTAWMTVRPDAPWTRRVTAAGCLFAALFALLTVGRGIKAFNTPRPLATFACCESACPAAGRAWRVICGACASRCSSP
jgi:uncharacterized membrane protein